MGGAAPLLAALLVAVALGDGAAPLRDTDGIRVAEDCATLLAVLPPEVTALELLSCDAGADAQVIASATFSLPGDEIEPWIGNAQALWGLGEVIFACCGHESRDFGALPTDALPSPRQRGAITALTLSFFAPGWDVDVGALPLGSRDGRITVEWVEI